MAVATLVAGSASVVAVRQVAPVLVRSRRQGPKAVPLVAVPRLHTRVASSQLTPVRFAVARQAAVAPAIRDPVEAAVAVASRL